MASRFGGTNVLCIPFLVAGATVADAARAQGAAEAAESESSSVIEAVTVTAQRRAESIQDVPISVSALSGGDIQRQALVGSDQLQVAVPALNWMGAQFGSPHIRGIGAANVLPGSSSSVPIYVDGVLQITPQQSNFGLYGVERVEVLKGPQGTLFGRNASGGVISITTREPDSTPTADIGVGFGNFSTTDANFFGNTGLTDTLSANLAVSYLNQGEGWGKNLTSGQDVFRERTKAARAKLRWQPSETTSWTLGASYTDSWNDKNTAEVIDGYIGMDGNPSPGYGNTRTGQPSYFDREVLSLSLSGSTQTQWGEFISISAYSKVKEYWSNDVDGVAGEFLYADYNIPSWGWTQEFRLVSDSDRKLRWVAGFFYQRNKSSWDPLFVTGSNLGGAEVVIDTDLSDEAEAVYADLTYSILPSTNVTVGARWSMNDEQVSGRTIVNGAPGPMEYQTAHFQKATWRVVADHKLTSDSMIYASVTTGFNQGTFNSTAPGNPALEPETVTAIEIGEKSEFFGNRLRVNVNVYHQDYKNLQTSVVTELLTREANVGKVKIKGAELEIEAVPVEGLALTFSYNYNDATYADFNNAVCFRPLPNGAAQGYACDATGKTVRLAPKHALGASITYDVTTPIGLFGLSVNESYKTKSYWDFGNTITNDARSVLNATLRYTPTGKPWSVQLRGRNLTDSEAWTQAFARGEGYLGYPSEPRTYSAAFEMHF